MLNVNSRWESTILPGMILTVDDILVSRPNWSRQEAVEAMQTVAQKMADSFETIWRRNLEESLVELENGF